MVKLLDTKDGKTYTEEELIEAGKELELHKYTEVIEFEGEI